VESLVATASAASRGSSKIEPNAYTSQKALSVAAHPFFTIAEQARFEINSRVCGAFQEGYTTRHTGRSGKLLNGE